MSKLVGPLDPRILLNYPEYFMWITCIYRLPQNKGKKVQYRGSRLSSFLSTANRLVGFEWVLLLLKGTSLLIDSSF